VGLGETFYAPTVVQAAVHDHFGPLLIGRDPFEVERHWEAMFRLSDHAGYGGAELRAISALDVALWDLKGQAAGLPVYELLGGAVRRRIRVYATGMPYEGAADLARRLLDEGITAMKGGPTIPLAQASDGQYLSARDLDRALRPFREIREAVGMDMELANDGHGKWTLPVAVRIAQAMEPLEPMWQEDLMPLLNPQALLRLQEATRTPVCISERLLSRWQHRQFIENGAARIVMPDLIWTGGVSETHKVAILASAHQVPLAPHDATGPVNIFACAQVCMSAPNAMIQEHVPAFFRGWYDDFVEPNLDIRDGHLHAPQRPGIGTRLKPGVRDRPDAVVVVSDQPGESPIDHWGATPARSEAMQAEVDRLRRERGPA
jgi:galactonate dehydratase